MCRSCESHLVYTDQLNELSLYEKVMLVYTCVDCRQSSLPNTKETQSQQLA